MNTMLGLANDASYSSSGNPAPPTSHYVVPGNAAGNSNQCADSQYYSGGKYVGAHYYTSKPGELNLDDTYVNIAENEEVSPDYKKDEQEKEPKRKRKGSKVHEMCEKRNRLLRNQRNYLLALTALLVVACGGGAGVSVHFEVFCTQAVQDIANTVR